MKKTLLTIALIVLVFFVLDKFGWWEDIGLFVLVGLIPGTDIVITPVSMMSALATAGVIVLLKMALWPTLHKYIFKDLITGYKKERSGLKKKRSTKKKLLKLSRNKTLSPKLKFLKHKLNRFVVVTRKFL